MLKEVVWFLRRFMCRMENKLARPKFTGRPGGRRASKLFEPVSLSALLAPHTKLA